MKLRDILLKLKEKAFQIDFHDALEKLQSSGKLLLSTVIVTFVVMALACLAVFSVNVKGPEQVLVPDVTGKKLTTALIEMQAKKLYPEIQLRYSETPGDEGTILEQDPSGGAIRKGFSHISLVVSRGVVIDHVENYIGENIDSVRMKLQTLFAGSARPLIVIASPQYKADTAEAGTILEQNPPEGTNITDPVTVHFVVSRGPNFENTRVPDLIGNSVSDVLQQMSRTRLVFDFTAHTAEPGENAGTVVHEQTFSEELVANYTHVALEFAFPRQAQGGNIYGIFEDMLPTYPYPVQIKLTAEPEDGDAYTIVTFSHPGGAVTIPYAVPKGTELVLYVVSSAGEKEHKRITVR
ncbi:PASTA domain-containing protein [Treponema socranskii]|uniref:PASTA domain-containing protein n=1 Tax=Treponema socranskii TaxID=53419 RepID=UPI003D917532